MGRKVHLAGTATDNLTDTFGYQSSWGNGCPYNDPAEGNPSVQNPLPARWKGRQLQTQTMKHGTGGHLQPRDLFEGGFKGLYEGCGWTGDQKSSSGGCHGPGFAW